MNVTRRSHFVYEYYLRSWATDKLIFASMHSCPPFQVSVENIAHKRDFYKVTAFNEIEKNFLIRTIDRTLPPDKYKFLMQYLGCFEWRFKAQKLLNLKDSEKSNIQLGEDLMNEDEQDFIKFLDSLKDNNIAFCVSNENIYKFYSLILMQYFRTKRMYDDLKKGIDELICEELKTESNEILNVQNIITPFRQIMAYNVAHYLINNKSKTILFKNNTSQEFITSDQPVLNTYVDYSTLNRHTDKVELYYPITPNIAILISNNDKYNNVSEVCLNIDEVDYYNRKIMNASKLQVYCSKVTALDRYIDKIE